jgi:hypothetical protein
MRLADRRSRAAAPGADALRVGSSMPTAALAVCLDQPMDPDEMT